MFADGIQWRNYLIAMADWAFARLCESISFSKDKITFLASGRLNNKVKISFVHSFSDMTEMIMNILFGNFQKTREFL